MACAARNELGGPERWDVKIADFGLHATVEARSNSDKMQHM